MKKLISIILLFTIIFSFTACGNTTECLVKSPVYPKAISFDDFDKERSITNMNPVDKEIFDAISQFTYHSSSKLFKDATININYSPISLYLTLALASTGANKETKDEIYSVLNIINKDDKYISKQCANLFRLMYTDNEIGKLKLANSLWLDKNVKFKDYFIKNAADNFYTSLYNIDFNSSNDLQHMSQWISDNTNGLLKPNFSTNPEQILSIINTIYFFDEWIDRFDEDKTAQDKFYLSNGDEIKCDYMNMTYSIYNYTKGENYISSSLIFKNSGRMIFVLPNEDTTLNELVNSSEDVEKLFNNDNSENGKVVFKIPKFSFGTDLSLKEMLKNLGMNAAFSSNADFSNMTDDVAFISDINQQTHIAIDEKGVEAAAFTKIDYCGSPMPNENIAEIILDRPFLYAITDDNGVILFIGICNNPLQK